MKRIVTLLLFPLVALSPLCASTDDEVAARKTVLDLAGAFSNDGFKLRDGSFSGVIHPKESLFVQVNLYAGNQYWFSVGANEKAKKLAVTIFDETGKAIESEPYQDDAKAAAGFSPDASGAYYIRVQELEGEPANFCLIYSYK